VAVSRSVVALVGAGILGIAAVGMGAGASFTDAVHANQTISAGTMHVTVTSSTGTVSSDGRTITLPSFGPVGSTFETRQNLIRVHNSGNIPVTTAAFQLGETHGSSAASAALLNQMNVCIMSTDPSGTWTEGNGPLTTGIALTPSVAENPVVLQPGQSMTFSVGFYAGQNSTNCGAFSSSGPNTMAAWDGYDGGPYHTPASLTPAAMGGVVTPTLTFSFTG
jgi:predicted ribosomally synthesized peptide with SipW-like signal peptide